MERIRKISIRILSSRADLPLPLKMHLARKYDIDEWIGSTFCSLMDSNLASYSSANIDLMGNDIYKAMMFFQ